MTNGVCYVVYGDNARNQARESIKALRRVSGGIPIAVASDGGVGGEDILVDMRDDVFDPGARMKKLSLLTWSPFDNTLYLDADTRPMEDVQVGFDVLGDGWEMVVTPSVNQAGPDWLWHCGPDQRTAALAFWNFETLVLQAGVMWVKRCPSTTRLFSSWFNLWIGHGRGMDQAALLMALRVDPVRLWLFGRPWNGGALMAHLFGQARRA